MLFQSMDVVHWQVVLEGQVAECSLVQAKKQI